MGTIRNAASARYGKKNPLKKGVILQDRQCGTKIRENLLVLGCFWITKSENSRAVWSRSLRKARTSFKTVKRGIQGAAQRKTQKFSLWRLEGGREENPGARFAIRFLSLPKREEGLGATSLDAGSYIKHSHDRFRMATITPDPTHQRKRTRLEETKEGKDNNKRMEENRERCSPLSSSCAEGIQVGG